MAQLLLGKLTFAVGFLKPAACAAFVHRIADEIRITGCSDFSE
jgi:hypothetical protein